MTKLVLYLSHDYKEERANERYTSMNFEHVIRTAHSKGMAALVALTLSCVGFSSTANPADPLRLQDVNISKRIMGALSIPTAASQGESETRLGSKESIARTILLQMHTRVTVDRLKEILKWDQSNSPEFAPGLVPAGGFDQPTHYIFSRTQDWRVMDDGTVSVKVIWAPFNERTANHHIETQRYRKDGESWYLFKQERREIPGCKKWPRCVGDET